MYFKPYTRKSSAVEGIKRAGLGAECLAQHEGQWGYFLADSDDPKLIAKAIHIPEPTKPDPVVEEVKNAVDLIQMINGIYTIDRRKILRGINRDLQCLRRHNKQNNCGANQSIVDTLRRSQRNLRNGYVAAGLRTY